MTFHEKTCIRWTIIEWHWLTARDTILPRSFVWKNLRWRRKIGLKIFPQVHWVMQRENRWNCKVSNRLVGSVRCTEYTRFFLTGHTIEKCDAQNYTFFSQFRETVDSDSHSQPFLFIQLIFVPQKRNRFLPISNQNFYLSTRKTHWWKASPGR